MVASFSSRGPTHVVSEILKPDVVALGAKILAAWSAESLLTRSKGDARRASFNIMSGTSMACPHVAALLRHGHPYWTPAMIRWALMTTAVTLDKHGRDIADNSHTTTTTSSSFGGGARRRWLSNRAWSIRRRRGGLRRLPLRPELHRRAGEDVRAWVRRLHEDAPGGAAGLNYPSFVVGFGNGTDVRVLTRAP
jgi:hypothetical protein